jgi:tricorn protease
VFFAAVTQSKAVPPALLHTPTISGSEIVFVYADELWTISREGGTAHLLTSGPGVKSSPALSPDGKWLAFSLDFERNVDVYVMPAEGGIAKRLTHHPAIDDVVGWTPDSKQILFRSNRNSYSRFNRLFTVAPDGGLPVEVPLPMAESGSYSGDGSHLAYVPFTNARRLNAIAWHRYRGGSAARVLIANLADSSITKVPRTDSQDWNPMWVGSKIYFLSDRHDGIAGLYEYNTGSHELQECIHPERDIKNASATKDKIVYEQFGSLHLFDVNSGRESTLNIQVSGDVPSARPHFIKGAEQITSAQLSPSGARAVFESHGEILTVPREKGDIRNLTNTPGAAERYPAWSNDGKRIAYFSDDSSEYALYVRLADGTGEIKKYQIPGSPSYFYNPVWSPDNNKIAFTDKRLNLWYLDLAGGQVHKIDTDLYDHPERSLDPAWSPDSRWIAYTKRLLSFMHVLCLYSLDSGKTQQVTDGLSDARHPSFDSNGKYLYFLASTDDGTTSGWLDLSSFARPVTSSAYLVVLSKDEPSPLAPQSDDEKSEEPTKAGQDPSKTSSDTGAKPEVQDVKAAASKPKNVVVKIDFENLRQRILAMPLPASNYVGLFAGQENTVFVVEAPLVDVSGGDEPPAMSVSRFNLNDRKPEKLWESITQFTVSFDGKRVLYSKASPASGTSPAHKWYVDDATKPAAGPSGADGKELNLTGMNIYVDPRAEWEQMFNEVGREERDFFYDPQLHGLDLKAALVEYRPYLTSLSTRQDLSYLWEDMLGSVTVGHLYIRAPFNSEQRAVKTGLLGADFAIESGRYRFRHIYRGENWNPQLHAPLTEPGVIVNEGDYLLEVNGRELKGTDEIFELFQGTAGKTVILKVGPDPSSKNARTVNVVPIDDERSLRNRAWIDQNRRRVDELSDGKLAYVYLPDTATGGFTNFNRYYFAQVGRQGAVIDERFNGGGAAADYIIEGLRRPIMSYWMTREGHDFITPVGAIFGPKVMIINEHAGSGGDALPWYFRQAKLGPLVGTRTWGGLVGIYDYPQLLDGAEVTAPRVAFYSPNQQWEVENHGVEPDIEVEFDPEAWRQGRDPQLEKAVSVALDELKVRPLPNVSHPAFPNYNLRTTQQPTAPATSGSNAN